MAHQFTERSCHRQRVCRACLRCLSPRRSLDRRAGLAGPCELLTRTKTSRVSTRRHAVVSGRRPRPRRSRRDQCTRAPSQQCAAGGPGFRSACQCRTRVGIEAAVARQTPGTDGPLADLDAPRGRDLRPPTACSPVRVAPGTHPHRLLCRRGRDRARPAKAESRRPVAIEAAGGWTSSLRCCNRACSDVRPLDSGHDVGRDDAADLAGARSAPERRPAQRDPHRPGHGSCRSPFVVRVQSQYDAPPPRSGGSGFRDLPSRILSVKSHVADPCIDLHRLELAPSRCPDCG